MKDDFLKYKAFIVYEDGSTNAILQLAGIDPEKYDKNYVYYMDYSTGMVTKAFSCETLSIWEEINEGVYGFTKDNQILYFDFSTGKQTSIYCSEFGDLGFHNMLLDAEGKTFGTIICDGKYVVSINFQSGETVVLGSSDDIVVILAETPNSFFFETSVGKWYYRTGDGENIESSPEDVYCAILSLSSPAVTAIAETENIYDLSPYGPGSYFTDDNEYCGHHAGNCGNGDYCNCKFYGYGIQCVGYALYAYDRYSHRSSWTHFSADDSEATRYINSASDVFNVFAALPSVGDYVRFSDYDGGDGHALFLESFSGTKAYVYECNIGGSCQVRYHEYYLSTLANSYMAIIDTYSHHFRSSPTYANNGHRYYCTTDGCTGYRLTSHTQSAMEDIAQYVAFYSTKSGKDDYDES